MTTQHGTQSGFQTKVFSRSRLTFSSGSRESLSLLHRTSSKAHAESTDMDFAGHANSAWFSPCMLAVYVSEASACFCIIHVSSPCSMFVVCNCVYMPHGVCMCVSRPNIDHIDGRPAAVRLRLQNEASISRPRVQRTCETNTLLKNIVQCSKI